MAGGSETPESHTDEQCKHCRRWYDYRGIYGHQEDCPVKQVKEDLGLTVLFDDETADGDEGMEKSVEDTPAHDDGGGETPEPISVDPSEQQRARADGGQPMNPPTPANATDQPSDPTDDVPDHYADVDEWIGRVEERNPNLTETDDWARICAAAEQHEYVDLDATDLAAGEVELV